VQTDGRQVVAVQRVDLDLEEGGAARELAYADNRTSEIDLDWDVEQLLADLEGDVDLGGLFRDDELEAIIGQAIEGTPPAPEPQMDKAAELQEKWQVGPGDIWRAGRHFIICGDCRDPGVWARLLKAAGVDKVNGVFTSPPYAEQRKELYGGVPVAEYVDWWEAVQANVCANLADGGSFFVNIKPHCEDGQRVLYVFDLVLAMVRQWGWRFVEEYIWKHQGYPGVLKYRFKNQFEPIYQFSINPAPVKPSNVPQPLGEGHYKKVKEKKDGTGDRYLMEKGASSHSGMGNMFYYHELEYARPGNVVEIGLGDVGTSAGAAPFPTALPSFFVKAFSDPSDIWLDPFLGSGTTVAAAHNEKRRGLGIELLERYVAVSLQRLADMGLEPHMVDG